MGKMFDEKGKLNIPVAGSISIPKSKIHKKGNQLIISKAYCPKGHSLMSNVQVDGEPGLHFIYTNKADTKETDIVISSVVKNAEKRF